MRFFIEKYKGKCEKNNIFAYVEMICVNHFFYIIFSCEKNPKNVFSSVNSFKN